MLYIDQDIEGEWTQSPGCCIQKSQTSCFICQVSPMTVLLTMDGSRKATELFGTLMNVRLAVS